jgi:hypothetical protein
MNQTNEKVSEYLDMNSVKRSEKRISSDKKMESSYRVFDRGLYENMYYWDPSIYRFIRVGRLY